MPLPLSSVREATSVRLAIFSSTSKVEMITSSVQRRAATKEEKRERLAKKWLLVKLEALDAGEYQARVVVRVAKG